MVSPVDANMKTRNKKYWGNTMRRVVGIFVIGMTAGAALGVLGGHVVTAQQAAGMRTQLLTKDLGGVDGYEIHMWRTHTGPGVVGPKHYHPGTECNYILEGSLILEEAGTPVSIKAGEAHCVAPKTILVPRNASSTEPYESLVVMIAPKGQPIAVEVPQPAPVTGDALSIG
jgi:quercetin dioxygenase-like cupin family protein